MNGQRCPLILFSIAVSCWVGVPIASSQNLTDQWVEKVAAPLVENRVADGLSVGYIEGKQWGIVHLGTSNRAKKKADNLTVYEIGSVSKVFTSLLLADAVVRGEIDLNAAADVANRAGIRLTPDFIFDVHDRDGHLMVGITNQPTNEVFPDSPTRWSYRGIEASLVPDQANKER